MKMKSVLCFDKGRFSNYSFTIEGITFKSMSAMASYFGVTPPTLHTWCKTHKMSIEDAYLYYKYNKRRITKNYIEIDGLVFNNLTDMAEYFGVDRMDMWKWKTVNNASMKDVYYHFKAIA